MTSTSTCLVYQIVYLWNPAEQWWWASESELLVSHRDWNGR